MAGPTDQEQLMLELINDARLNPVKNAARFIASYGPLRSNDPDIQAAFNFFSVSGADLQRAYSTLLPTNPLAWNDALGAAAEKHSAAMISANSQSHQLPGEANLIDRLNAEGYKPNAAGENIFGYVESVLHAHAAFMVDWGEGPGGMQSPAGHRSAILSGGYSEIGIDVTALTGAQKDVGPLVVTQDFGTRGKHFILGVAYTDKDSNQFYSLGEGRGDLVVQLGGRSVTTAASGGYSLEAPDGAGIVTLSGGGLAGAVTVKTIGASVNLKLDIVNGTTLLTSGSVSVEGPITELRALTVWGVTLTTGAGNQTIFGTEASDQLNGGAGNDTLKAGGSSDTLQGGTGDDILDGGLDNDVLNGGDGNDVAVFAANRSLYTVTGQADGSVRVSSSRTGNDIATGVEIFRFTDGDYLWNPATKTLTAKPAQTNQAPTIIGMQSVEIHEDSPRQVTITASDPDGDPLTFTTSGAANGTVTGGTNGVFTYTPKSNFHGADSFAVTVSDGHGGAANYTAMFTVLAVNDAPTAASSQHATVSTGASKLVSVVAADADGDALTYSAGAAGHGTVSGGTKGVFAYQPSAGYVGSDSFSVSISDGRGGTTSQSVNVTIGQPEAEVESPEFQVFAPAGFAGTVGGAGTVFGGTGLQDITIADTAGDVVLDVAFNRGGDIVRLPGKASEFLIHVEASAVVVEKDDLSVIIPYGSVGMPIVFEDGARTLVYDAALQAVRIGSQVVGENAAQISAPSSGSALPSGLDPDATARIFLAEGGEATLGGDFSVFGTGNSEEITYVGGDIVLDPTFNRGGDTLHLLDSVSNYSATLVNSVVILTSADGQITIPIGPTGIVLDFAGDERTLLYDIASGLTRLGEQTITDTPVQLGSSLPGGTVGLSLDTGAPAWPTQIDLDPSKHYSLNDAAGRSGYATIRGFGNDDVIHVTGASASDYNFGTGDGDRDGSYDDLLITFSEGGIANVTTVLNVISPGAFIFNEAMAETTLGWDFITFG